MDLLEQNYNHLIKLLKYNNASKKVLTYAINLRKKIKKGVIDQEIINTMINGIHPLIIKIMLPTILEQLTAHKKITTKRKSITFRGGASNSESYLTTLINWFFKILCRYINIDICKQETTAEEMRDFFKENCDTNTFDDLPWIERTSVRNVCSILKSQEEDKIDPEIIQHNVTVFNNLTNNYDLNVTNTTISDNSIREVLSNINDTNKTELIPHIYNFSHLLKKVIGLPTKIETPKLITMVKNVTKIIKIIPIPEIDNTIYDLVSVGILNPIEFDVYFNKVLDYDSDIPQIQLITWFKELTINDPSKKNPFNPNNPAIFSRRIDLIKVIMLKLIEQATKKFPIPQLQPTDLEYKPYKPPRITSVPQLPTDEFSSKMICLFLISLFILSGIFIIIKMFTGIKSIFSSKKLKLESYYNVNGNNNGTDNGNNNDNDNNNGNDNDNDNDTDNGNDNNNDNGNTRNISKKRKRNNTSNSSNSSKKRRINTNVSSRSLSLPKFRKKKKLRTKTKTKQVQHFYKQIIKLVTIIERQLKQKMSKASSTPTIFTMTKIIKKQLDNNDDFDPDFIGELMNM